MKKIAFVLCCLIGLMLSRENVCAQSPSQEQKDLYSVVTPYEKARKKLSNQAALKLKNIMTPDEAIAMGLLAMMTVDDNLKTEIGLLESEETLVVGYIGVTQLSRLEEDQNYYNKLMKSLGHDPNAPKNRFAKWYISEFHKLEKLKTDRDRRREYLRHPPAGSVRKMEMNIAKEFSRWSAKGEYEKMNDYENRLAQHAEMVFDSICCEKSIEACLDGVSVEVKNYDADKEEVEIEQRHDKSNSLLVRNRMLVDVAKNVVPKMKDDRYLINKERVVKVGVSNNCIYASQVNLRYYDEPPVSLTVDLPLVNVKYADLGIGDSVLDKYMEKHVYKGQSIEELALARENVQFSKWQSYFKDRAEYREYVNKYGEGETFEKRVKYKQYSGRLEYDEFEASFGNGGFEEVERYIALKDTCKVYVKKYNYHDDRAFLSDYCRGGLNRIEQKLQQSKENYLREERERIERRNKEMFKEYGAYMPLFRDTAEFLSCHLTMSQEIETRFNAYIVKSEEGVETGEEIMSNPSHPIWNVVNMLLDQNNRSPFLRCIRLREYSQQLVEKYSFLEKRYSKFLKEKAKELGVPKRMLKTAPFEEEFILVLQKEVNTSSLRGEKF